MNDYKQVFKNVTPVARTLSEANRDADYATPIWYCESENKSGMRLLGYLVGMLFMYMFGAFVFVLFLHWFGVLGLFLQ
jgi:predicted lipid-binding transport protein (Tim44 family)